MVLMGILQLSAHDNPASKQESSLLCVYVCVYVCVCVTEMLMR